MEFRITAWGHPNILSSHKTTWQLTRDEEITPRADCIIGVRADTAAATIPRDLKVLIRSGRRFDITLKVEDVVFRGQGRGHPDLELTDTADMVFRRSDYVSDRTVLIGCNFSAIDLPEEMRKRLKSESTRLEVTLRVID